MGNEVPKTSAETGVSKNKKGDSVEKIIRRDNCEKIREHW